MPVPEADQIRLSHLFSDDLQPRIDWAYDIEQGGGGGGSGLPSQWSDGGHGDVTATVDDATKTAFTIEAFTGQMTPLFDLKDENGDSIVLVRQPSGGVDAGYATLEVGDYTGNGSGIAQAYTQSSGTRQVRTTGAVESDAQTEYIEYFFNANIGGAGTTRDALIGLDSDLHNGSHRSTVFLALNDSYAQFSALAVPGQTDPLLDLKDEDGSSVFRVYPDGTIDPGTLSAWRSIADVPSGAAHAEIVGACAIGTMIYVVGVASGNGHLYSYDTTTETWTQLANVPYDFFGGSLLCAHGANLILIMETGDLAGHTLDYTVNTDTWSETRAPMPSPVNYFQGDVLNCKAYVAAGAVNGSFLDPAVVQIYDFAGDAWTTGAAMSAPRAFGAGVFVDGIFFSFTGQDATLAAHRDIDLYDPVDDAWDAGSTTVFNNAAPPPVTPLNSGIAVLDGNIILVGGSIGATGVPLSNKNVASMSACFTYDPSTGIYAEIASIPWAGETVAVTVDGVVYAFSYQTNSAAKYVTTTVEIIADLSNPMTAVGQSSQGGAFASLASDGVTGITYDATSQGAAGVHGIGPVGVRGDGVAIGVRGDGVAVGVRGEAATGVEGKGDGDGAFGVFGHATGTGAVGVLASTLGVQNAVSASSVSGHAVVNKIEVFDDSGVSLGFIPVYDAIT